MIIKFFDINSELKMSSLLRLYKTEIKDGSNENGS